MGTKFEIALNKGEEGEKIIQEYLEKRGWIIYRPVTKDKPHYFDMLVTKNKEIVVAIDVKTKARLNKWDAQGIDIRHYNEYVKFIKKINIPFYLIFVDDKNGNVHRVNLKTLINKNNFNPTPNIIAWYLRDMEFLFKINDEEIKNLSQYDQRSYKYEPVKN